MISLKEKTNQLMGCHLSLLKKILIMRLTMKVIKGAGIVKDVRNAGSAIGAGGAKGAKGAKNLINALGAINARSAIGA